MHSLVAYLVELGPSENRCPVYHWDQTLSLFSLLSLLELRLCPPATAFETLGSDTPMPHEALVEEGAIT